MTISEILISVSELFNINIDPDTDTKELAKTIQRAIEFSARFTRLHLYQLQRQLQDLKRDLSLMNSEQPHCEVLAARVLALHRGIVRALQIVHRSLRRFLWGQPLQALLDLLVQSSETCRLVPSVGDAQETGELFNDEIPILCTKLKSLINTYQSSVREIIRENEYYESPRSYWKMKRKSHIRESFVKQPLHHVSEEQKKSDKFEPKLKQKANRQGTSCRQNIGKAVSDQPEIYNENDRRGLSDRENDKVDKNIPERQCEVQLNRISPHLEKQQSDEADPPSASATIAGGGADASAHRTGQQEAGNDGQQETGHIRGRVKGSNVLLVCIEESHGQRSTQDTTGEGNNLESGTRYHVNLDTDSGNLWKLIGRASDTIVEEMLQSCMKEMQLDGMLADWFD